MRFPADCVCEGPWHGLGLLCPTGLPTGRGTQSRTTSRQEEDETGIGERQDREGQRWSGASWREHAKLGQREKRGHRDSVHRCV